MKLRHTILVSLALGLTSLPSAFACELHGGGYGYGYGGYDQQDWLTYYEERRSYNAEGEKQYSAMPDMIDEEEQSENESSANNEPQPRAKPSFSSSATRASDAAKIRLAQNKPWQAATANTQNETR